MTSLRLGLGSVRSSRTSSSLRTPDEGAVAAFHRRFADRESRSIKDPARIFFAGRLSRRQKRTERPLRGQSKRCRRNNRGCLQPPRRMSLLVSRDRGRRNATIASVPHVPHHRQHCNQGNRTSPLGEAVHFPKRSIREPSPRKSPLSLYLSLSFSIYLPISFSVSRAPAGKHVNSASNP